MVEGVYRNHCAKAGIPKRKTGGVSLKKANPIGQACICDIQTSKPLLAIVNIYTRDTRALQEQSHKETPLAGANLEYLCV